MSKSQKAPLAVENLNQAAIERFRNLVTNSSTLSKEWREAILTDTKDGIPSTLTKTNLVGKGEGGK